MTSHYNLIKQVTKSVRNLKLRVRIDRSWDHYLVGNETLLSKDMILIDEKGDQINASITMEIYPQFKEKVQDGSIDVIGFYNNIGELQKNIHTRMGQSDKKSIYIDNESSNNPRAELPISRKRPSTYATEAIQVKNLEEIDTLLLSTSSVGKRYKFKAKISDIDNKYNWHYNCCESDQCRRKVELKYPEWWCDYCSISMKEPTKRYKVQFEIEDSTCKKLITTFDDEAEYLLQHPLDELLKIEKQENGFDLVSEILEEPIGKEYEFEVRITKYNCENGKDSSLTVSKIDKIEKGIKIIKQDDEEPNAKKQCVEIQD
ncbi:hypothetical protein IFM89_008741 [Coptis chinensis]|uniref:Replication factor A C-terminal domain-containing protein n=1 Tax=Coptis chinensis TaxID=261450 RepID=A0A835HL92_9MAGN|nr:hypothetical protein IFM89_008741 [Coptis chinensis]